MADSNYTQPTPEELAEQFPCTARPFAVWYNSDPGADHRKWAVNDENGYGLEDFEDMATALMIAAELKKEWDAEGRIQAQVLAKVEGSMTEGEKANCRAEVEKFLEAVSKAASIEFEARSRLPEEQFQAALQAATDAAQKVVAESKCNSREIFRKECARQVKEIVSILIEEHSGYSFKDKTMEKINQSLDAMHEIILV